MSRFTFNFPLSRFAPSKYDGYTRRGQADQITQEAAEAFSAAEKGYERQFIMELLDCIHACETALSEFDDDAIDYAWERVVMKNADRGYYGLDTTVPLSAYEKALREAHDPVNHPAHYEQGGRETIDIVEHVIAGVPSPQAFHLGCLLKYVIRAGKKGDMDEDLAKANNFAHRLCTGEWRWEHEQEA